jgi:aldose 1-epimerase
MASFRRASQTLLLIPLIFASLSIMGIADSSTPAPSPTVAGVTSRDFGKTPPGEPVKLYTLTNKNGVSVSIMNYGATIVDILVPDRNGVFADVALGFDHFTPYLHQTDYLGATIGRYANRIAKGTFVLDRVTYHLPVNNGPNSLHGGARGFDKHIWKEEAVDSDQPAVRFSLLSSDGDQGYPGNLFATVTFTLNDDNELRIDYRATSDKKTVINLTNHSYFNLAGAGHGLILDQVATLHADSYLPSDANLLPTGEIKDVTGTIYDFRQPTPIGLHLNETGTQPIGYDTAYVLKKGFFSDWQLAAEVDDPHSGRTLKVYTDQPSIQFYTGNFLDGSLTGKGHKVYQQHAGFCLETQHYPDSPNHDDFPSTVLQPGDTYKTSTVYAFGVK